MNNHLRHPQETQLRQYSLKALYCKGFRLIKMHILALFTLFSPFFGATINIPYKKKTQKPLCLLRFRALPFFLIKTDNALILYILISLVYAIFFAMIEKMDSRVRGNDKGIKTNNIYLQTVVKETFVLITPLLKPL
ncbi:hypothetical protein ES708_07006 [subsurface metagenome]